MELKIIIDSKSSTPKYEQLVKEIIRLIKTNKLKLGDKLPSLNAICNQHAISRDTVTIAYNELKSRGIIQPKHGKGFYVASTLVKSKLKIFMLFDVMNGYKETLYRSIVQNLGKGYEVDIYFHYYNLKVFEQLIANNLTNYGYYIIMPHFNEDVSKIVSRIPKEKLLIIDKDIPTLSNGYAAIYQNFEKDTQEVLEQAFPLFANYKRIIFLANRTFQFIPNGIETGISDFFKAKKIKLFSFESIEKAKIDKGDAYIVLSDHDLIEIIKTCEVNNWQIGNDIGILSYDETPLKEVLAGGISVISTDFNQMGKQAAQMIKNKIATKVENKCNFIQRKSL